MPLLSPFLSDFPPDFFPFFFLEVLNLYFCNSRMVVVKRNHSASRIVFQVITFWLQQVTLQFMAFPNCLSHKPNLTTLVRHLPHTAPLLHPVSPLPDLTLRRHTHSNSNCGIQGQVWTLGGWIPHWHLNTKLMQPMFNTLSLIMILPSYSVVTEELLTV